MTMLKQALEASADLFPDKNPQDLRLMIESIIGAAREGLAASRLSPAVITDPDPTPNPAYATYPFRPSFTRGYVILVDDAVMAWVPVDVFDNDIRKAEQWAAQVAHELNQEVRRITGGSANHIRVRVTLPGMCPTKESVRQTILSVSQEYERRKLKRTK